MASTASTLALLRVTTGVTLLLFPTINSALHLFPLALPLGISTSLALRLGGAREVAVAMLLWRVVQRYQPHTKGGAVVDSNGVKGDAVTVQTAPLLECSASAEAAEVGRKDWVLYALKMGMVLDAVDVLSCVACALETNDASTSGLMVTAGTALAGCVAWAMGWWSCQYGPWGES